MKSAPGQVSAKEIARQWAKRSQSILGGGGGGGGTSSVLGAAATKGGMGSMMSSSTSRSQGIADSPKPVRTSFGDSTRRDTFKVTPPKPAQVPDVPSIDAPSSLPSLPSPSALKVSVHPLAAAAQGVKGFATWPIRKAPLPLKGLLLGTAAVGVPAYLAGKGFKALQRLRRPEYTPERAAYAARTQNLRYGSGDLYGPDAEQPWVY